MSIGLILSFGLLILMGAIMCITFCFSAALKIMPYISGMLICLFLNTIVPFTKNLIPGHPFMNYCALLFIVESLISLLMHLKGTGKATALCFSEIMVGIISMFILDSVKPDSIGYCIFVTVIYVIGNMIFLTSNAAKYESNEKNSPVGIIISSLLYALAGYFIIAIPAELLWQKYIEYAFPSATVLFNIIYWVLRILVCGGIVVMGIKKARCSDKEILIIEDSVEITETENCNNQPY